MKKTRDIRRQQRKKFIKKAIEIAKGFCFYNTFQNKEEVLKLAEDWAKKNHKNRKACSCEMCRNPRRSKITKDKTTIQEKRALLANSDSDHVDDSVFDV